MKLSQLQALLDQGSELQNELQFIQHRIEKFKRVPGDTVPTYAYPATEGDYGRGMSNGVEMLPIPKSQVISALERDKSKVIAKFAQLGVDYDEADVAQETLRNFKTLGS